MPGQGFAAEEQAGPPDARQIAPQAGTPESGMDEATQKKIAEFRKASDKAYAAIKDIGETLKGDDAKHFYMTYSNYNLIGTAKMVRSDVANAIKQCGTSNPDMKTALDESFKTWSGAIDPVLKEADANIGNMIIAQDYAAPDTIRKAFKTLDETREITSQHADKVPVTTADACQHLLGKMDETQDNLVTLLRGTLVSFGRANPPADSGEEKSKQPADADGNKTL